MKRTKKFLVGLLACLSVFFGSLGLAGCGDDSSSSSREATEIEKVYAQYVVYAQAEGQTPLSYEEWLATIKGEKGDTGAQGEKGEKGDTGAQGIQGEKGDTGETGAQGVGIEKVEYDENGNLLITFTDGTKQTVEMPTNSPIDKGATENLHYQKINGKEEYCVIGVGLASESDIVISSTYKGLPVTMIGPRAFQECTFLASVTIPDSVTMIAPNAFFHCYSLTSVEFGNGVTTIYDFAFYDCDSLTSITIPDSVTMIGSSAFSGCDRLQFKEYSNTKYLGSKTNDYFALIETKSKNLSSYTIHSNTKIIASYAFHSCSSLTSITIPDSVTFIGGYAFENCSSLQFNEYGNAKYLRSETNDYFALIETKSKNFSSYTIHNDTKIIADDAFRSCSSLTSIEIPDSVTYIGQAAFCHCNSLTSVTIGDGVTFIGTEAFYDCDSLTSITFNGTVGEWNAIVKGDYWKDSVPATRVVCSDGEVDL